MPRVDNIDVLPSVRSDIRAIDGATQALRNILPETAPSDRVIERALDALSDARSGLLYLSGKLNRAADLLNMEVEDIKAVDDDGREL
jgi:hypothetical protein